jgi:hypothetical protein
VNIGKTTKTKSRAPRKPPEPVRPQVIPVYTPIYQSQPQQQYNNDDLRTLFRARIQVNDNPLKELTREAKLSPINRPPIRLEEEKQGYTDPKLDAEITLDFLDPYDTRPPDSIMANAHFREVFGAEYQAFDEQFLKPEQAPTLTEAIGETTREAEEILPEKAKREEEPEPEPEPEDEEPAGGGGGRAEEPEQPAEDDLDDLSLYDLKEVVRRYNRENEKTKIQITKPNTTGTGTRGKNKDELIAELRAKRFR